MEEKKQKKHAAKSGPSSSIASNSRLIIQNTERKKNITIKPTNKKL